MAETIEKRYRREAVEFGMSEEYKNAEADVAESTNETIDDLRSMLLAKV